MLDIRIEYYMPSESGNAVAIDIGGWLKVFFSYNEPVAFWAHGVGTVASENIWTRTTGKHLNKISGGKRVPYGEFCRRLYDQMAIIDRGFRHEDAVRLMDEVEKANEEAKAEG